MKRPSSHPLKRPSGALCAKRPASAAAKASAAAIARPNAPKGSEANRPDAVYYGGGTIYTSYGKQGFRVLKLSTDNVDKHVPWAKYGGYNNAWEEALDIIDRHHGRI